MEPVFHVDEQAARFRVEQLFDAALPLVWKAFTQPELLDQWWAPHPWRCETHSMDFRPKGYWRYDMVSPDGQRIKSQQTYQEILYEQMFSGTDAFVDADGSMKPDMPSANFINRFFPLGEQTRVVMEAVYPEPQQLTAALSMGLQKGLSLTLNQLKSLLQKMKEHT
ncbi:MAG: SRPBCC domain-containing protein [Chitinophagales bacterium]|nr:SRPBCC domain-containing protein [Chitinophagales bacterium]MDW8428353.1 SRPBCC domain-containing protein [Chitinophagales bacterium]